MDTKKQIIRGYRKNEDAISFDTSSVKKYTSTTDALNKNLQDNKLYVVIYWDDELNTMGANNKEVFELIEKYPYNKVELVCIGSNISLSRWNHQSSSYVYFSHYLLDDPDKFRKDPKNRIELYKNNQLLASDSNISSKIFNQIKKNLN